ncbi:S8 family serine peptidase, partial [bacterium]|nr:S8 family serine peptidase [bacterium]
MNIGALNNFNQTLSAAQPAPGPAAAQAENRNEEVSPNISESFTPSQDSSVNLIVQGDAAALNALKAELLADGQSNRVTAELPIIGGFAVSVSPQDEDTIASLAQAKREGVMITVDQPTDFTSDNTVYEDLDEIHDAIAGLAGDKQTNVMFGVEQLHERGITGKGTTICVLDSGIAPHPDFQDRIIAFKDCVNGRTEPYDDNGHGTHCAGICAGSGESSGGQITGVAPEANIVGVKVLDQFGQGTTSQILKGIQWAIMNKNKYGIDVITMSLGHPIEKTRYLDPLTMGVQAAAKFGITVVVSAGNDGPDTGTLSAPGNAPAAITVGALDDNGTEDPSDD